MILECFECKEDIATSQCDLCGLPICEGCRSRHMSREESLLLQIIRVDLERRAEEMGIDIEAA